MPQQITIKQGQSHEFKLGSNPTTGYEWQHKIDDRSIAELEDSYERDDAPEGTCGAGGKQTFRIVGRNPGKTSIKLEYKRSWEDHADYTIIYEVTVN